MEIEKIELNLKHRLYQQAVVEFSKNKHSDEAKRLIKKWLRPILLDHLGLVSEREYDRLPDSIFIEDTVPVLGVPLTLSLHYSWLREDSFRHSVNFLEGDIDLEKKAVLYDAVLLSARDDGQLCPRDQRDSDNVYDFHGVDLNTHLASFGNPNICYTSLEAHNLSAGFAALEFIAEFARNTRDRKESYHGNIMSDLVMFRKVLRTEMAIGLLPHEYGEGPQWKGEVCKEKKTDLQKQITRYETALRHYF
ncbi:hypothetical protein HOC35_06335 [Candidatus Woesearchaeota archaeon]|nr:hypothetical protein [Candidatus Woesearchaeota archaeon]